MEVKWGDKTLLVEKDNQQILKAAELKERNEEKENELDEIAQRLNASALDGVC